jgi:tRNA(fMet)-specific endonuclease VapC
MKIVIDTNIYVDFAVGKSDVVDFLAFQNMEMFLPAVVAGELFYGFIKGSRSAFNEERFHGFIETLNVSIIPIDEEVARKYAIIFLDLSSKGNRIPINDVWIAACCMSIGGTLLTRDRHFEQVAQIDKIIM